jgi:hypothetical protein
MSVVGAVVWVANIVMVDINESGLDELEYSWSYDTMLLVVYGCPLILAPTPKTS